MPDKFMRRTSGLLASAMATMLLLPSAQAEVLESAVEVETGINQAATTSQKRITNLAQQTADLLAEYRTVVRETESLKIYNDNLEKVVMDQRAEVVSINQQLSGLEATNRGFSVCVT
jgi:cell division septum initiation protein DivIVA